MHEGTNAMRIDIPYGRGYQQLDVPDHRLNAVLAPAPQKDERRDQPSLVTAALENPVGSPRLCELAKDKQKIVLITSDHTRPVPSSLTLPLYLAEIRRGNPHADITILWQPAYTVPRPKRKCGRSSAAPLWITSALWCMTATRPIRC